MYIARISRLFELLEVFMLLNKRHGFCYRVAPELEYTGEENVRENVFEKSYFFCYVLQKRKKVLWSILEKYKLPFIFFLRNGFLDYSYFASLIFILFHS